MFNISAATGYIIRWSGTEVDLAHLGALTFPIKVGLATLLSSNRYETPSRQKREVKCNRKKFPKAVIVWLEAIHIWAHRKF